MIRYDPPSPSLPTLVDPALPAEVEPFSVDMEVDDSSPPGWLARAGHRTMRQKLRAGLRGLKHAVRGDSSFFAHAYRGVLVALAAALLGVGPWQWCLIALSAALILVAELAHSAIDTMARALGDPDSPGLVVAREIATAGVLVAVTTAATVWITIFVLRLGDLLAWW